MLSLGISCFFHDSAVAVVKDGWPIFCAQEERFTRIKGDKSFPFLAIKALIDRYGFTISSFDKIFFYENPYRKAKRIERTSPSSMESTPLDIERVKNIPIVLRKCIELSFGEEVPARKLGFSGHHFSHVMASVCTSPFKSTKSIALCLDAVGEEESSSIWLFDGTKGRCVERENFPNSIGLLYSAFTAYLGFKINSGEYKLMGLAPYGRPLYVQKIMNSVVKILNDDRFFSYRVNPLYISPEKSLLPFNEQLCELLGPARVPESKLEKRHLDIAASIQEVLHIIYTSIFDQVLKQYPDYSNICLSGGVALNCTANGMLKRKYKSLNFYAQPASGDAGGALGAAFIGNSPRTYQENSDNTWNPCFFNPYLGLDYDEAEIYDAISSHPKGALFDYQLISDQSDFLELVAMDILQERVVGLFQGKSEYGPRALGNRSIIANPMSPKMQSILNLKIKFRESFRPFAPSVLEEDCNLFFEDICDHYMLSTSKLKEKFLSDTISTDAYIQMRPEDKVATTRSIFNPITHVDGSARVQIVSKKLNQRFHSIISKFKEKSGYGLVVNTSFNVRGEPIVETPSDAINAFLATNIDALYVGDYIIRKNSFWNGADMSRINSFPCD